MKINLNIVFALMAAIIAGLILWNLFLLKNNSNLLKEKNELEVKYHYLEGYNQIIKYDLETSRDSVRILEKK